MNFKIEAKGIPHSEQRYSTIGDYFIDDAGTVQLRHSLTGNDKYDFLIQIHETVEMLVYHFCKRRQISRNAQAYNDQFDMDYEGDRDESDPFSEPGYDPKAPYYREHMLACAVEHIVAAYLGVDYNDYDRTTQALYEKQPATNGCSKVDSGDSGRAGGAPLRSHEYHQACCEDAVAPERHAGIQLPVQIRRSDAPPPCAQPATGPCRHLSVYINTSNDDDLIFVCTDCGDIVRGLN